LNPLDNAACCGNSAIARLNGLPLITLPRSNRDSFRDGGKLRAERLAPRA